MFARIRVRKGLPESLCEARDGTRQERDANETLAV